MTRHGATLEEWAHLDLVLGLTADLLPVVSRPDAVVAPGSSLKSVGKTPSRYNAKRQVIGLPRWTAIQARGAQIERWMREPDLGACVQTRRVRAIDVDVTDPALAEVITYFFVSAFGPDVAIRGREGSSRVLLAFVVEAPDLGTRVLRLADGAGIVEFLAHGQQFVACGTHPSGTRYEWWRAGDGAPGLPDSLPTVALADLDSAWEEAATRWHVGPVHAPAGGASAAAGQAGRGVGEAAPRQGFEDPVLAWLEARGWTAHEGTGPRGQVWIHCPFEDEHTADSGHTQTAYYPAGTGGYEMGHFHCLHAHCEHRTDADFLTAVGYHLAVVDDFPDLPVEAKPALGDETCGPGETDEGRAATVASAVRRLPAPPAPRPVRGPSAAERSLLAGSLPSPEAWFSTEPGQGLKRGRGQTAKAVGARVAAPPAGGGIRASGGAVVQYTEPRRCP